MTRNTNTQRTYIGWIIGGGVLLVILIGAICFCLLALVVGGYTLTRNNELRPTPHSPSAAVTFPTQPPVQPQPQQPAPPQSPIEQQQAVEPQPAEPQPAEEPALGDQGAAPLPGAAVGEDVVIGQMRWRLLAAEDSAGTLQPIDEFSEPLTTEGRFIRLTFEVENQQADVVNFGETDVYVSDGQGRSFIPSSDAEAYIPNEEKCFLEPLEPSTPRVCTEIYELPLDAVGLQFLVNDLDLNTSDEVAIDLGL